MHRTQFNVKLMCAVLKVSRSAYYAWCQRPESQQKREDRRLLPKIQQCFQASKRTYGHRRIEKALKQLGERCGKHRVRRLMRENGLKPKTRRKFKVTTHSKHNHPIHGNKLNRQFKAYQPNQRWGSDITYIPTREGWLYLAVIMDLYSRRILGWSMSHRLKEQLVIDALKMALFRRKQVSGLLLHSDRGSQYAAEDYQKTLRMYKIDCSMSRKGNCWDNAAMESFFGTLKMECVHHEQFQTREQAKTVVFEYIEGFYNQKRLHSYLNYQSPIDYELAMGVL